LLAPTQSYVCTNKERVTALCAPGSEKILNEKKGSQRGRIEALTDATACAIEGKTTCKGRLLLRCALVASRQGVVFK
jgi:hypothetical protein